VNSSKQQLSFEEKLWLDLVEAVVSMAREIPDLASRPVGHDIHETEQVLDSLKKAIQQVFTALLSSTTTSREGSSATADVTFLHILRAFLSNAAKASPTLSELRSVLASIFSAYAYEESLLSLSNAMLDKDVFGRVDSIKTQRVRGWRPRGQVCEVCRRRVWGPGIGTGTWDAWRGTEKLRRESREERKGQTEDTEQSGRAQGKGKATAKRSPSDDIAESVEDSNLKANKGNRDAELGPIVVFSCRHIYHRKCLESNTEAAGDTDTGGRNGDLGQGHEGSLGGNFRLACPACVSDGKAVPGK
jgi:hypothetical protein